MPADTHIRVTDASGNFLFETNAFLEIGNAPGLRYVLSCGQVGALTVTLDPSFNPLLLKDGRIHVMRSVNGGPAQREGESCFLIRRWDFADDYTTITALHANDLMRRRHILYAWYIGLAGTPGGTNLQKGIIANVAADDAIKTLWAQNAGGSIDTTYRAYSTVISLNDETGADLSAYVTVQASVAAAPSIYKQIFWRNMLDVIQEIADTSFIAGTFLTTEIVAPTESTLELRTYTVIRGVDRRFSTGNGLLFTNQRGNLANGILINDATNEITFVQSLGAGPSTYYRYAGWSYDPVRILESPFARIEDVFDANDAPNDATLTNTAAGAMRSGRPAISAVGQLVETDQCLRGVHFNYGDLVTVQVQGIQYDMRLDQIDVTLSQGKEQTKALFQYNG